MSLHSEKSGRCCVSGDGPRAGTLTKRRQSAEAESLCVSVGRGGGRVGTAGRGVFGTMGQEALRGVTGGF